MSAPRNVPEGSPVEVIVADDHPLFRSGVVSCLSADTSLKIVAEASDGEACIAKLELFRPHILIADLSMPRIDGFGLLAWAQHNQPDLDTYVLSMHTELAYVQKAKELGANGFLAKEDAQSELLNAVRQDSGLFYTSESIGREMHDYLSAPQNEALTHALRNVSKAEKKVLDLLTSSHTSREIAEKLNLSTRTVEAHRSSLAEKLGARGPNKLLELAITNRQLILGS